MGVVVRGPSSSARAGTASIPPRLICSATTEVNAMRTYFNDFAQACFIKFRLRMPEEFWGRQTGERTMRGGDYKRVAVRLILMDCRAGSDRFLCGSLWLSAFLRFSPC